MEQSDLAAGNILFAQMLGLVQAVICMQQGRRYSRLRLGSELTSIVTCHVLTTESNGFLVQMSLSVHCVHNLSVTATSKCGFWASAYVDTHVTT